MTNNEEKNVSEFLNIAFEELEQLRPKLNADFYKKAVEIILQSEQTGGRVHITGIGKPSYVAGYTASLLSSTGTPTYTLHGTEAVHGSSGQVREGDVVIAISNSGETAELRATVSTVKRNGAKIISVSGNPDSWLAKTGDAFLFAGVKREGDSLNRAPRASILAELLVLQGLSVILQAKHGLTPQQYVKWHPGGALGKLREGEK